MTVLGSAGDAAGNFWHTDAFNHAIYRTTSSGTLSTFKHLPFAPAGIAVDLARGRVYVADRSDNEIRVYDTATAQLIAKIH